MRIIGKTLEGDLIIQVSQAEWDGLQDGVKPVPENNSALQVLLSEARKCDRLRKKGQSNTPLIRAINAVRYSMVEDMPFDKFLQMLMSGELDRIRNLGPKRAELLVKHFTQEK